MGAPINAGSMFEKGDFNVNPNGWADMGASLGISDSNVDNNSTNAIQRKKDMEQMDFQTWMSNTAHQREMADLNAAGLNPALTAMGGSGASTSSGANTATKPPANPIDTIFSPLNSALKLLKGFKGLLSNDKNNASINWKTGEIQI